MLFLKAQDDFLKCFVLSTTKIHSVYCQRGVEKPENIFMFKKLESENFASFFSIKKKNNTQTN